MPWSPWRITTQVNVDYFSCILFSPTTSLIVLAAKTVTWLVLIFIISSCFFCISPEFVKALVNVIWAFSFVFLFLLSLLTFAFLFYWWLDSSSSKSLSLSLSSSSWLIEGLLVEGCCAPKQLYGKKLFLISGNANILSFYTALQTYTSAKRSNLFCYSFFKNNMLTYKSNSILNSNVPDIVSSTDRLCK